MNRRDRAVFAFIFLSGCRASEIIKIQRKQVSIYEDRLELQNVKPLKRGNIRARIIFPKRGHLAPLTQIFEAWFSEVKEEEDYLFPQHDNNVNFRFDNFACV